MSNQQEQLPVQGLPSITEQQQTISVMDRNRFEGLFAAIVTTLFEEFNCGENPEQSEQQRFLIMGPVVRRHCVEDWIEKIAKAAGKDRMAIKKRVGKDQTVANDFLHEYAFKLYDLHCQPNDVADYLKFAKCCLASLYLEAAQSTPSPLKMRQLAVRFATDPRHPLPISSGRFTASDCGIVNTEWWEIAEVTSPWGSSFEFPAHMLVKDFYSTHVLKLAFNSPPMCAALIEFIELMLGKVPTAEDALRELLEDKQAILKKLEPAPRGNYLAYQYAQSKLGKEITDQEAFDWLQENRIKSGYPELDEYVIPSSVDTFGRYLRGARAKLGENKYEKRTRRRITRSIVGEHQIEHLRPNKT